MVNSEATIVRKVNCFKKEVFLVNKLFPHRVTYIVMTGAEFSYAKVIGFRVAFTKSQNVTTAPVATACYHRHFFCYVT